MVENKKLETLGKDPTEQGKQVFLNTSSRVGDSPNKMVIGSGTAFRGSDINTDFIEIYGKVETSVRSKFIFVGSSAEIIGSVSCNEIEIHGSVSGAIQAKGKVTIKKTATVVGSLRYESVAVEEGANIYSDLHCTNADQKYLDRIAKLKKQMNLGSGGMHIASSADINANSDSKTNLDKEDQDLDKEDNDKGAKKKRYFFK